MSQKIILLINTALRTPNPKNIQVERIERQKENT
jgi:hypothetical protein